jgi:hypothetical protein
MKGPNQISWSMMLRLRRGVISLVALAAISSYSALAQKKPADAVIIAVSPAGSDTADGTPDHPFRTLQRAQRAVRESNAAHDVTVQLADGIYRIAQPLRFSALDGGRNGHRATWAAAPAAHPVISGAIPVKGWTLWDKATGIYVANTPIGLNTRELWVNDRLAPIAETEIRREDYTFAREGMTLKLGTEDRLKDLQQETRLELRATGFFTERVAPVARVSGQTLVMRQPSWDNNLWGYDTVEKPFNPKTSHLYLANSLKLLTQPGQWMIDPVKGKLYLRPPVGTGIEQLDVELPQLTVLISIGDSLDRPVQDLKFAGIRFSHTSWLGPSGDEGYASQQSGSYLTGRALAFPKDPITACAQGCPAFETVRNEWSQVPASVQVSAAARIVFDGDVFAHLGQYALGVGNDADADLSGVGLGTSDVTITRCVFTDDAGGAILAGGVRRDAHHPHDVRQVNRQLIVSNNRIQSVSKDFRDHSAILSTYVEGAILLHNDISDVPYDAIDIGYGWGMHDPGGNPNYRVHMHGYDSPANLVYQTPTTHRDVVVASNRVHGAKRFFHDGGAIYNLSAGPGTLITENYIFDNSGMIGLYLDEGSRYITVRRNVVEDPAGEWLNINTVHNALPLRISVDNTATGNWHDSAKVGGLWTNYENDLILDDHLVTDGKWPEEAQSVMRNAGIEKSAGDVSYGDARPSAEESAVPHP